MSWKFVMRAENAMTRENDKELVRAVKEWPKSGYSFFMQSLNIFQCWYNYSL